MSLAELCEEQTIHHKNPHLHFDYNTSSITFYVQCSHVVHEVGKDKVEPCRDQR
jgi:hypothetical protein